MAKLFISLYLMVLASFIVFLIYIVSIDYLGGVIGEGKLIEEKVSKGTFMLLTDSVDGLTKEQTDTHLKDYKKLFGNGFMLLEESKLKLSEDDLHSLNENKVISVEENQIFNNKSKEVLDDLDTVTILYRKRANTTQVWRLELDYGTDISINESGLLLKLVSGKFSNGMMVLLQSKLLPNDPHEWPDILKQLQVNFGMPLSLVSLDDISQDINNRERIEASILNDETINISQGTNVATFIKKIPNSQKLLQIGPIEIPWYVRNMPLLIILAFGLSVATTLFIWLWPLWSNLIKIKQASEEFGSGKYDTRIPLKRFSPIKNVTKAFNSMAEHTQRSIRSQKELTSAVSHELRTPVARMRFALEMLAASDNKEDKFRYVSAITEDINELDLLLEELLSYARFDQNNPELNPSLVKIIPWLDYSMNKLLPLAKDKQLIYNVRDIEVGETTHFEPRLMSRVLDNLVQNALRYAKVKVKVTLKRDGESYLLMVEDDGEGIPKEKREYIFDAFSRIDASRDRASGGFGLGLAIVDRIVKAHKGNVIIRSSYLGGACFEVRFH
jgi:two-component system sensor histidine kinase RstB